MPTETHTPDSASKRRKLDKRHRDESSNECNGNKGNDSQDNEGNEGEDDGPACSSCRKRKTKCSRQQPCSQCQKLKVACIYDDVRERPGMKTGAIEALNQRISTLEQMFLGQGILLGPLLSHAARQQSAQGIDICQTSAHLISSPNLTERAEAIKHLYTTMSNTSDRLTQPRAPTNAISHQEDHWTNFSKSNQLPPLKILHSLVELYFAQLHPWIPILHVTSFREKFRQNPFRQDITTILQAIVSVCLRFSTNIDLPQSEQKEICLKYRQAVILQGMDKFSVENLQALVIISLDIIGSGRGPSAWSVVGSMARTVEQLQLSVEDGEENPGQEGKEFMIRRMQFLRTPSSWVESEERRRVFWNIFLMDRFCSVATGLRFPPLYVDHSDEAYSWNNSLTGADVRRRLPCEGAIWQAGTPVKTPRFGIAGQYGPSQQALTPASERQVADEEELESIGGFAFCIEASESLNLVTKFFLQYTVKFDSVDDEQIWLMKFKELDLRLVKWRLYLPPKWRSASVLNQDGIMDPNLTLAHITHNTAVIQLHQSVAYPSMKSHNHHIRMPSQSSSDTCVTAACEISTIAQQYLSQSPLITNPQFSFCLFIAGRVLLAHAAYYGLPLHDSVERIIESLREIAMRWSGTSTSQLDVEDNLASKFGKRLQEAKTAVEANTQSPDQQSTAIDITQPVYSGQPEESNGQVSQRTAEQVEGIDYSELPFQGQANEAFPVQQTIPEETNWYSPDSISLAFPPLPAAFEHYQGLGFFNQPVIDHETLPSSATGMIPTQHLNQEYVQQAYVKHGKSTDTHTKQTTQKPPVLGVDSSSETLDAVLDDQYQQMLRVSMFSDDR